jgi:hypothetical protein
MTDEVQIVFFYYSSVNIISDTWVRIPLTSALLQKNLSGLKHNNFPQYGSLFLEYCIVISTGELRALLQS